MNGVYEDDGRDELRIHARPGMATSYFAGPGNTSSPCLSQRLPLTQPEKLMRMFSLANGNALLFQRISRGYVEMTNPSVSIRD